MYRVYLAIGIVFLLLLLAAGFVALAKSRFSALSVGEIVISVAGLFLAGLGALVCCWGLFVLVGGPDGLFPSSATLGFGSLLVGAALVGVLFALRLLSMPSVWVALFLAPAAVAVVGQTTRIWPLTLAAFSGGPPLCLAVIVALWVRQELRGLVS